MPSCSQIAKHQKVLLQSSEAPRDSHEVVAPYSDGRRSASPRQLLLEADCSFPTTELDAMREECRNKARRHIMQQ